MEEYDARFNRRIRFSAVVIVSQMLLIALSLAWGIYLILIARNGGVLSIENNPWILYAEIVATFFIIQFALIVVGLELYRLRVRRHNESTEPRREQSFAAAPRRRKKMVKREEAC